jgi:glyoxylase-like metal-dependent hydrolase (beta-lactamase superfamily II)
MRVARTASRIAFALLVGCAAHSPAPAPPARAPARAAARAGEDPTVRDAEPDDLGTTTRDAATGVGTYVSIPWGFSTSSYFLEGPGGLVAIDTQFLTSAAEEMITTAEQLTGKKFVLAIVLHANPDKFNGTAVFQKRGVRVVTSAQVKALLPSVHEKRMRAFYERYKPDYPSELPAPDVFGDKTTVIEAGGMKLKLHVMGAGCSESHVVVEHDGGVFVGDLVANGSHSWLEIGKTDEWLARIDELERLKPSRVYPGRGKGGSAKLLDDEATYLKKVISLVAAEKPSMPVREDALARVEQAAIAAYPRYEFPVFLKIGLPAEWERQARTKK